ncbi:MAG: hypothetical protein J5736_00035, partial [Bacilli bacterium]|nr:hypothetical protein [Bacilli bacterium]
MIDIKLILEGSEEETFFQILEEGGFVRSDRYRLSYWNAHGAGNVPTLFNQAFQNSDPEDIVLAVYDVDLLRTDEFHTVQRKMRTILGSQNEVDRMSIWCNPTSLLLLLAP